MTDLLGWSHLSAQVRTLTEAESAHTRAATYALVEISACLYAAQHMGPTAASQGDLTVIEEIEVAVEAKSHQLADRFNGPAVHMASPPTTDTRNKSNHPESWRPFGGFWTAPVVEPASAWPLWSSATGNARTWSHQVRYASPRPPERIVIDSLDAADTLVGSSPSTDIWSQVPSSLIERIDFSWRVVLQAECSVLRGERTGLDFPVGLGSECSVWRKRPKGGEILPLPRRDDDETGPVTQRWFDYG